MLSWTVPEAWALEELVSGASGLVSEEEQPAADTALARDSDRAINFLDLFILVTHNPFSFDVCFVCIHVP